ncbi:hypothetical protein BLOT_007299 [Blomia tropicalis]|nr:hypothetical protein BLOT_007299 [Blomia tropicalis]
MFDIVIYIVAQQLYILATVSTLSSGGVWTRAQARALLAIGKNLATEYALKLNRADTTAAAAIKHD